MGIKNNTIIKASVWYTVGNFINRAIGGIMTPIMTRLLSQDEYGDFANFTTWTTLLAIITTLDMGSMIVRAKFDYEEEYDEYMSSLSGATIISTAFFYLIVFLFQSYFCPLFDMNMKYVNVMFIYLLFAPICTYFSSQQIALNKYKLASFISIITSLLSVLLSVGLVLAMNENRLWGRTIGFVLPYALIGVVLYGFFWYKGKKIVWRMIKYTLLLSIPLIPHHLSNGVLNASDRIVIKKYCSSNELAIYSLGYSIVSILYIFIQSISQAYTPWLFEKLDKNNYEGIRKTGRMLAFLMFFLLVGILLLGPEEILIFGGKSYMEVLEILPVLFVGYYFQFLTGLNISYEHYIKKTYIMSVATVITAIFNLVSNFLFIPMYGYKVAAYTTLASYILLFIIHSLVVAQTKYRANVDNCWNIFWGMVCIILIPLFRVIYYIGVIRFVFVVVYIACVVGGLFFYYKRTNKK